MRRTKLHPKDSKDFLLARNIAPRGRGGRAKASTPEAVTQEMTEQYLDLLGLQYVRIPAYALRAAFGYRPGASGAELGAMSAASSYLKGLPDLIILSPNGRFLALELKTDAKASKMTAAQRMWRAGIGTREARSFEEAKAAIDSWYAEAEGIPAAKPSESHPNPPNPNQGI